MVSPKFSGKNASGEPLKDHQHIFILPLGNSRGRIDRVLIYTRDRDGFDSQEVQTILQVRSLYGQASEDSVRVVATWRGECDDSAVRPRTKEVISLTPFVPVWHWRKGRRLL